MGSINDFDKNNIFEDKVFKRKIRVMNIKQTLKTLIISAIAIVIIIPLNEKKVIELGMKETERKMAEIRLEIKGGYTGKMNINAGILEGRLEGDITKDIMGVPVRVDEISYEFGYLNKLYNWGGYNGGGPNKINKEWDVPYYPNGHRQVEFFHPELEYKKYRNDLKDELDRIDDNKIMEVAISFDKAYGIGDLFKLQTIDLNEMQITYIWLNEFTEEFMKNHKEAVENYDSYSAIKESETVGFVHYGPMAYRYKSYSYDYEELMELLKISSDVFIHNTLYNEIEERGRTTVEEAEVLGIVVQGTKKELEAIKDLPFIKASAIGVITDY